MIQLEEARSSTLRDRRIRYLAGGRVVVTLETWKPLAEEGWQEPNIFLSGIGTLTREWARATAACLLMASNDALSICDLSDDEFIQLGAERSANPAWMGEVQEKL